MRNRDEQALLCAADLHRLGDLMFVARRLVEGVYAGRHRSPRRGHSTEFHDYRPYTEGDEPRRVDWKAFGRSDRLYVRRYRHDAQLDMHLLLDRSASMDFAGLGRDGRPAGGQVSKWTLARQLAAAMAMLAARQADRVSLTVFDYRARPVAPAGGTWGHLQRLIGELQTLSPGDRSQPVPALRQAHAAIAQRRRGMVVLIGDLLEEAGDWLRALDPFIHDRFDIVVFHVLSPQELDLHEVGGVRLVDLETRQSVRTFGPSIRQDYRRRMARHIDTLRRGLAAHGADYQLMTTAAPPVEALRRFVVRRQALAAV